MGAPEPSVAFLLEGSVYMCQCAYQGWHDSTYSRNIGLQEILANLVLEQVLNMVI